MDTIRRRIALGCFFLIPLLVRLSIEAVANPSLSALVGGASGGCAFGYGLAGALIIGGGAIATFVTGGLAAGFWVGAAGTLIGAVTSAVC